MSQGYSPTAEHHRLGEAVGRWAVECTYFMLPGQPPLQARAQDNIERVGPYWTLSNFRSEMMGAPFRGHAAVGFDPVKNKWVSTWIDSMSPFLFVLEGGFDTSGKVLAMTGEVAGLDGRPVRYRTREEHLSRDHRVLDMFHTMPDSPETQMFRFVYRRLG